MPNIKFNYLYRDSGNYKKYKSVIFSNPDGVGLSELETFIKPKLISETWFYAQQWDLPEIFTDMVDFRIDPSWHEFESIEYTDEEVNTTLLLIDFMENIERIKLVF